MEGWGKSALTHPTETVMLDLKTCKITTGGHWDKCFGKLIGLLW